VNLVFVVFDTLRQDHVGAYGNDWIHTPNLDAFASEATRYTRAYPESLPTLCVRRALHTGIRTFPYHGHRTFKGDMPTIAPGWGPIPEEQDTIAELLSAAGYRTALISDCYHIFKPSKNFHRGFDQWTWIRGQEGDKYRTGPALDEDVLRFHTPSKLRESAALRRFLTNYLINVAPREAENGYFPALLFDAAERWLHDNADAERFFLVVDSFDPHEPWDPPPADRALYDDEEDVEVNAIQSIYGPWEHQLTERELRRLQANYAGEVTLVDRHFGRLMDALERSGRLEDSIVVVMSDHGHNLGYPGDQGLVSKQGHPMTHAVADLVAMVRHPGGVGAGAVDDALVYQHDLVETALSLSGTELPGGRDGRVVWSTPGTPAAGREHVTIGWGPLVTVVTDDWWYNANIWGEGPLLFATSDTSLENDVSGANAPVCEELRLRAVDDAGGAIPDAFADYHDRPGCTPFDDVSRYWESGATAARP